MKLDPNEMRRTADYLNPEATITRLAAGRLRQAADEIERLTTERDEYAAGWEHLDSLLKGLGDTLGANPVDLAVRLSGLQEERDHARAENERLRAELAYAKEEAAAFFVDAVKARIEIEALQREIEGLPGKEGKE